MDEVEVTARFDEDGKPFPKLFFWKGESFLVDSVGRRWEDETGKHILVMVPGGRVFELLWASEDRGWYLIPASYDLSWV